MDLWAKNVLFTRQQVAELSGVEEGVLTFWIRNELLVPTSGGQGRGSHRKFAPVQVTIAALLGAVQQFGVQIGSLKGFAGLLQRGVELCAHSNLHPFSLWQAARHAIAVDKIANGGTATYWADLETSSGKVTLERRETGDLEEFERAVLSERMEHDPPELIIEFSRSVRAEDFDAIQTYVDIRGEMEGLDTADAAWLLWQDDHSHWQVGHQTEPGEQFTNEPESDTALFIAAGRIIRRVWKIDLESRKREREIKRVAMLRDLEARRHA